MVNCGSSIAFIIVPSKLNFSSLLELWAVLCNATNMVLLRTWGFIPANYVQLPARTIKFCLPAARIASI